MYPVSGFRVSGTGMFVSDLRFRVQGFEAKRVWVLLGP